MFYLFGVVVVLLIIVPLVFCFLPSATLHKIQNRTTKTADSNQKDKLTSLMRLWLVIIGCSFAVSYAEHYAVQPAVAAPETPTPGYSAHDRALRAVPDVLKPWIPWVLANNRDFDCVNAAEDSLCEWPTSLELSLGSEGGTFQLSVRNDRAGFVQLPGGGLIAPISIETIPAVSGAPVVFQDDRPAIFLPKGNFTISGRFEWSEKPKSILVPPAVGMIKLSGEGERGRFPRVSAAGELWLGEGSEEAPAEADSAQIEVFRRLNDGIPFEVVTKLALRIAGKSRELDLGIVSPEGGEVIEIGTTLPYRLGKAGELIVHVRPGEYEITLRSIYSSPPETLSTKSPAIDREAVEIWSWKSNEAFRSATVEGAPGIDPNRTSIPADWRDAPAYVMEPNAKLTFATLRRGERESSPNQIAINREIVLDLDGSGATVSDQISGTLNQGFRLNSAAAFELGQVVENGEDLLITMDPASKARGVELRSQNLALTAISRLNTPQASFPATGLDHNLSSLSVNLRLPPGWQLLHASGVEYAPESLISSWTLLDFFLLMLIAICMWKLVGIQAALIAFAFMLVSQHEPYAPRTVFISVLISLALLKVAPEGAPRRFVKFYFVASVFGLIAISLLFAVGALQYGLFPQASRISFVGREMIRAIDHPLLFPAFVAMLWSIWALVNATFRLGWFGRIALFCFAIFLGLFMARSVTEVFFSYDRYPSSMPAPSAPARSGEYYNDLSSKFAETADRLEENVQSLGSGGVSKAAVMRMKKYDAKTVTQTGPGVPNWGWSYARLSWSGSLSKDLQMRLWLLSPNQNLLLSILRVALLWGLLLLLLRKLPWRIELPKLAGTEVAAMFFGVIAVTSFLGLVSTKASAQELPSPELLKELETRLVAQDCSDSCVTASEVTVKVVGQSMTLDAVLGSVDNGVWTIPGPLEEFVIENVVEGDAAPVPLRRDGNGFLQARLSHGEHHLKIVGQLRKQNGVVLQFPDIPRFVRIVSDDWVASGVSSTGSVESSLELSRKSAQKATASVERAAEEQGEVDLPDWFYVTRELSVGLPWTMKTTVRRLGKAEESVTVRVPLQFDRNITTEGVKVEDGFAIANFARGVSELSWSSSIPEQSSLTFLAAAGGATNLSEEWQLDCSPLWICAADGITPTSTFSQGKQHWIWQPFPGETLNVRVVRPEGATGQTVTVDSAEVTYDVGTSTIKGTLGTRIRSSQGGFESITLPEGATVISTTVDGRAEVIRPEKGKLALPLQPGARNFQVLFELPWEHSFITSLPKLTFASRITNLNQRYRIPRNRWILWAGGTLWNPAVLFWPELLLIVLVAFTFSRMGFSPLSVGSWVLLGIGMAQLSVELLLVVAAWFLALQLRGARQPTTRWRFNLLQIGLVGSTLLILGLLYSTVYHGLILTPNMSIVGMSSSDAQLNWYTDIVKLEAGTDGQAAFPRAWFLSLPLWSYRVLMLAWSTWLVVSLISWLTWAYNCFSANGLWRKD